MRSPRYWTVIALMLLAVVALYRRGDGDHVPPSTPLSEFPVVIGNLPSTEMPIDPEALAILGQGFFLNRIFTPMKPETGTAVVPGSEESGPIGLFIAYFPTQRTGQSIHSPQNCLPGSGWSFETSGTTELVDATGKRSQVADYVIVNGDHKAEVLYWYQSHGRAIASDYKAKLYMLADSIRYSRSDAALVRVITPIQSGESRNDAHRRAAGFAEHLIPMLPAYIPD
jgi:EpsI family protein